MSKINENVGSVVDLVKAAQSREYMSFEDQALAILKNKIQNNPVMKEKLATLNTVQGITEADDEHKNKEGE